MFLKALKVKLFGLLQSHSKATPKQQSVERQALDEFLWSFGVIFGKVSF